MRNKCKTFSFSSKMKKLECFEQKSTLPVHERVLVPGWVHCKRNGFLVFGLVTRMGASCWLTKSNNYATHSSVHRNSTSTIHPFIHSSKLPPQPFIRSSIHRKFVHPFIHSSKLPPQPFIHSSIHRNFRLNRSSIHPFSKLLTQPSFSSGGTNGC